MSDLYGQELMADFRQEANSYLSVNVGISIPSGRFSQSTIYENYGNPYEVNNAKLPKTGSSDFNVIGFANPGINLSVDGAWFFYKIFGIGIRASFSQNMLATNKLDKEYATAYGQNSSFNFSTDDYYYSAWVMPGVYLSLPLGDDFSLNLDAGFGPEYLHTPDFKCDYQIGDINYSETTASSADWDFSYYVSIGAKYKYDKHIGFSLDLLYNDLPMNFDFETTKSAVTYTNNCDLFVKTMNISLGIVYFF